ncbi:MAG: ComF family protein [Firmicutes bacterium]|nr:ComF family protein [Bacillota bacterium]MDI6707250.1 ComF family protein [Bacillota bacterium]
MNSIMVNFWEDFLDLLYPDGINCYFCGEKIAGADRFGVCSDCMGKIAFIGDKSCMRCGKLLETGELCSGCRSFPYSFDRAISLCLYDGKVKEWIYAFKYGNKPYMARPFARMMAARLKELEDHSTIRAVVPIPLHVKKQRQRGYNQAHLLGRILARELKIKQVDALVRKTNTPPLSGLTRLQRMECLEGAFEIKDANLIRGIKNVLLVDDIYTTGTTTNQCARVLKNAGCDKVYVLTLASGINL